MSAIEEILSLTKNFPKPGNQENAERGIKLLREHIARADHGTYPHIETLLLNNDAGLQLLNALFGNSPYLSQLLLKRVPFIELLLEKGYDDVFNELLEHIRKLHTICTRQVEMMTELRIAKQKAALLIAIADISELWDLFKVTHALSVFADETLSATVNFLLLQAHRTGDLTGISPDNPAVNSGLIILGMGKLGGFELNYSSDIDIIIFFDPEKVQYQGNRTLSQFFIKLSHDLVKIMQERTPEGYVFRTDLRLRPDPASMPVAISVTAALLYYESLGQNWERAAMIKARPVAGDMEAGKMFLKQLIPYVWRKYLDFASIQDIHSIKRQIDSKQGSLPANMGGYNLKIGHGGIREIEFFVQTQQLIWGGKLPELRVPSTCEGLKMLATLQRISPRVAKELTQIYIFLRTAEHRLQMVADNQTHSLPLQAEKIEEIAIFLKYESSDAFVTDLKKKLSTVQKHYAALFKESPTLGNEGSLVFTGTDIDPETVNTLERMGYENGRIIAEIIRGWHHGRYRGMKTKKARELLTELTPAVLRALSRTSKPDSTFLQFDKFLSGLPSGVQIFSLFNANPHLLDLIADIMGTYPYLAANLSRHPVLLEYVLYPEFLDPIISRESMKRELEDKLKQSTHYEDMLDRARRWTHDKEFQVGVQLIKDIISPQEARRYLSDIAEAVLATLLKYVQKEFEKRRGNIPGGEFCIVAMGKLGSRQFSFGSDLDLVLVYDVPDNESYSDGIEPLNAANYFSRLSRRFLSSFNAPTNEGKLYEIDLRLRPSGENAPIATSLESFDTYYECSAWTWEYMALTRARVIGGDLSLSTKVIAMISQKLTRVRDAKTVATDIVEMREKIAKQYYTSDPWNVKYIRGGLVDLEFIAQYFQLVYASKYPSILHPDTLAVFKQLTQSGILRQDIADKLQQACTLFLNTQTIQRLVYGAGKIVQVPEIMQYMVSRTLKEKNADVLTSRLIEMEHVVKHYFLDIIVSNANK